MPLNKIAVIGLGYVGLPLAVEFAKQYHVIGFDINKKRVNDLNNVLDVTHEVRSDVLKEVLMSRGNNPSNGLKISNQVSDISDASIYIITVPTPIDSNNKPLLSPLLKASKIVGKVITKNDIVIYESTVFPGLTEDICVPVLEDASGLQFNTDFFVGYSPERINPGDKTHTVTKILKITSGSTPETAKKVDDLYKSIITAGTYLAPSIKVAEAAKVIENAQRDINIAFVNELSKIFRLLDIDTKEVLKAAGTKWNFLNFTPGLVGGHCIGVDPYYLAQKAIEVGYDPEIILVGRKVNDGMGNYVAQETVKLMIAKGQIIQDANVLVLGITFKENCPDTRNSKVIDIINELKSFSIHVDVFDPLASVDQVKKEYNINLINSPEAIKSNYNAIILAVAHQQFLELDLDQLKSENAVVFDVKAMLPIDKVDARL
ncbi:nucleotide sugar dehydrogenase [Hyunsoonleella aestuarii]|uniref:Nucleotide sugar dehydrogenase n=1 Tax=Hyunsoonleella aestuarii TaxID=912802 RepID=A0ABP8E770_9FLAO|nr:nucleotide sugar dehydrogenase [Hyunsoonleella aestuarii]